MSKKNLTPIVSCGFLALAAFAYIGFTYSKQNKDISTRSLEAQERLDDFVQDQITTQDTEPKELAFEDNSILKSGEVLVVNRVPGDDYGKAAIRKTDGSREILDIRCLRLHATNQALICLNNPRISSNVAALYNISGDETSIINSWATLSPSRARISNDNKHASTTVFASGSSYEDVGEFKTFVEMIDVENSDERKRLSEYTYDEADAKKFSNLDGNFWGVTFAPDNAFYATFGLGNDVEIIKGSLSEESIESTKFVGSCPSVSPDGKTLVFKERVGDKFQLVAVNLVTDEKTVLNESRSVDDQVEWLDNETILYSIHKDEEVEEVQPEFDIWSLKINNSSSPELFLPNADSPSSTFS